jgi:hypothetical protein
LKKKIKSDQDEERFALLDNKVQTLEKEIQELKSPKPATWDTMTLTTRVIGSLKPPPKPPAPMITCSVCGKRFPSDADLAQRFSPWAELVGPNGRPLRNFAKEGYLYWGCSLDCDTVISQAIDRLTCNIGSKVNLGVMS